MKATLYDVKGKKKGEIDMPVLFNQKVRLDIMSKFFEVAKFTHPYAPGIKSGKKHSASGTISHKRHDWKGHYGKAISRVPRKTMWRRGTQFFWVGAEVSSVRGGRRAHPPKGIGAEKKMNKKEIMVAFNSGFAATTDAKLVEKRYSSLDNLDIKIPMIIESKLSGMKTKDIIAALKSILGDAYSLAVKKKAVRAGKGKMRGRKYKSNAGLLVLIGSDEEVKINGFDVKGVDEVTISDLYPLGRLTIYTEMAIKELGGEKK